MFKVDDNLSNKVRIGEAKRKVEGKIGDHQPAAGLIVVDKHSSPRIIKKKASTVKVEAAKFGEIIL